jgi:hypothetical protein
MRTDSLSNLSKTYPATAILPSYGALSSTKSKKFWTRPVVDDRAKQTGQDPTGRRQGASRVRRQAWTDRGPVRLAAQRRPSIIARV